MLTMLGCTVTTAENGAAAVDIVRAQRERGRPFDAVLMDVHMPVMNGIQAAAAIRASEAGEEQRTPIIAYVAAFVDPDERTCCLEHMDDYTTKPLTFATAQRTLQTHVRRRINAEDDETSTADDGSTQGSFMQGSFKSDSVKSSDFNDALLSTPVEEMTVVNPSIFSPQEILVTSGSNAEFVRNVISWFSGEPAMQAVDEALAAENCEDLRIAAHTIKGSLGYLYAHRAVEAAKALEQLACTVDQTGEWDDERRSQLSAARAALRAQVDRVEANRLIYLAGFEADRA